MPGWWRSLVVEAGQTLAIGAVEPATGVRGYLAVQVRGRLLRTLCLCCPPPATAHSSRPKEAGREGGGSKRRVLRQRAARVLCVARTQGGIDVPLYLGSRATFPSGKFGGYQV